MFSKISTDYCLLHFYLGLGVVFKQFFKEFLQFKDFELYWGAVFFKICWHIFMISEVKLE